MKCNKDLEFYKEWKDIRKEGKINYLTIRFKKECRYNIFIYFGLLICQIIFYNFSVQWLLGTLTGLVLVALLVPVITWNYNEFRFTNIFKIDNFKLDSSLDCKVMFKGGKEK